MGRKVVYLAGLLIMTVAIMSSCGQARQKNSTPSQQLFSDSIHNNAYNKMLQVTPIHEIAIPKQIATPTPTPKRTQAAPKPTPTMQQTEAPTTQPAQADAPTNIPNSGVGAAPYGPPPSLTSEEIQLAQQLFAQINSDRAVRGLYPFAWNSVLAGGARLHAWNMFHCGFSHTCPDGRTQCQRIYDEGFTNYTDCGENIAYAGPYPTPWQGALSIQEGMINEPPTGWHRIHLTSMTLHRVGVGVYVDPSSSIWFVEDMVS